MKTLLIITFALLGLAFWLVARASVHHEVRKDRYHCPKCHRNWDENMVVGSGDDVKCPACLSELKKINKFGQY